MDAFENALSRALNEDVRSLSDGGDLADRLVARSRKRKHVKIVAIVALGSLSSFAAWQATESILLNDPVSVNPVEDFIAVPAAKLSATSVAAVEPPPLQSGQYWYDAQATGNGWNVLDRWIVADGAATQLPGKDSEVIVDNSVLTCANSLCVGNGVQAECKTLTTGNAAIDIEAGGSLAAKVSGNSTAVILGSSAESATYLRLAGSLSAAATITVGANGGYASITNIGGTLTQTTTSKRSMVIGSGAGSYGEYVQNSGTLTVANNLRIANGLVEINGGSYTPAYIYAGSQKGGVGIFRMNGGSRSAWSSATIGEVVGATGIVEVTSGSFSAAKSSMTVGDKGYGRMTLMQANRQEQFATLSLGVEPTAYGVVESYGKGTSVATLSVGASGCMNAVFHTREGSTNVISTLMKVSGGRIAMSGGGFKIDATNSNYNVQLGSADANAYGEIVGWGKFTNKGGAFYGRLAFGNGRIVGDGGGLERELSLNLIYDCTNWVSNGAAGTNGWYAVNRGSVILPCVYLGKAAAVTVGSGTLGTAPGTETPDEVGAFRFSVTGKPSAADSYFRGGVFAADRTDCHLDSLNGRIIGVWKAGLYSNRDTFSLAKCTAFDTVSLTFRYDHTKVKDGKVLELRRWNGTSWKAVGTVVAGGNHVISTSSPVECLEDELFNAGTFAVIAPTRGLVVVVR